MQSTISRCFKPGVSVLKKMRARIMNAAEDLGYPPNAIARSLISNTNAVFAPYRAFGEPSSSIYHQLTPHGRIETPAERINAGVALTG